VSAPREPRDDRAALGVAGEARAGEHLEELGFRIVAKNHRTRRGEVDLIAEKGELLVFAEVRTRSTAKFGAPEETVDPRKQKRIILAARDFLSRYEGGERAIRFDVIAVLEDAREPSGLSLRHLPDAFDAGGY